MQLLYLGGLVDASADILSEMKRQTRLARACYNPCKRELYDMEAILFTSRVPMPKAEVMKILLYRCVTWTLDQDHVAELQTAHHNLFLRIIGFQR